MERPIITTSDGKVQGITLKSILGSSYLAFKGIPFAQPPIGPLRFKAPQPPFKWSGIRDASKYGNACVQYTDDDFRCTDISGSEDCLYLNIYTQAIGLKRPVMVYIHGGSYLRGSANDSIYGPDYFMETDVVLVTFNYRLGPLGFLNLGHEVASGNQGLRDMILALKWVKRNIDQFGGDPGNVTIFGHSSGSNACHLLTLLPMTKNLFHKAILQSATVILANLHKKSDYKNGFRIASLLGMESKDPVKVAEFLRTVPAKKLVSLQNHILSEWELRIQCKYPYLPVIDIDFTSDPVVPCSIDELLRSNINDVPMIIGHTADECLIMLRGRFDDDNVFKLYNDNIDQLIESVLPFKQCEDLNQHVEEVKRLYLNEKPITKENVRNLVRLLSDIVYHYTDRVIVDIRNEKAVSPTYFYNFSYLGNEPTMYQYDLGPQLKGIAHTHELSYLFYISYIRRNSKQLPLENTEDKRMMERMIKMWYNFALTGHVYSQEKFFTNAFIINFFQRLQRLIAEFYNCRNPTPDDQRIKPIWRASSKSNLYYLDIGDEIALRDDKNSESRRIYEEMRKHFYFVSDL